MHYFKFRGLAYSFLLASFVYLLVTLALITTAVFGVGLWVTGEEFFMYAVAISAGTFFVLRVFLWVLSGRTRCQLCKTGTFQLLRCNKSGQVSPIFGSYRLKVSLSACFTGKFNYPYCGEQFDIWAKPLPQAPTHSVAGSRTRKAGSSLPGKK